MCQKNCAKLFLSELRHICTNFDNFVRKGGKDDKILPGALIFHLIQFASHCLNACIVPVLNFYVNFGFIIRPTVCTVSAWLFLLDCMLAVSLFVPALANK